MENQSSINAIRQRDNALFRFLLALIASPLVLDWTVRVAYYSLVPDASLVIAWLAVSAFLWRQWRAALRKERTHAKL